MKEVLCSVVSKFFNIVQYFFFPSKMDYREYERNCERVLELQEEIADLDKTIEFEDLVLTDVLVELDVPICPDYFDEIEDVSKIVFLHISRNIKKVIFLRP